MAITVVISLDSQCASGGHLRLRNVVNGGTLPAIAIDTEEARKLLTAEEIVRLVELLAKGKCQGLNATQARNALQTGFTVTIT